jgi:hypothetical protein
MLKIQGSGKGTLSMDYNFFVAQSRAVHDPRRYEAVREQTLQTYLRYFKTNYAGNRAAAAHRASFHELRGRRL